MADPARSEERRELERRAFGPSGSGLTEAEAARLAELRRADAPTPAPPGPPSDVTMPIEAAALRPESPSKAAALRRGSLSEDVGGDRDETRRPSGPPRADPSPTPDPPDAPQATPRTPAARVRAAITAWLASGRWKRPRYLLGGLIALVLVGVVIGVAIPRPPDTGLALRAGEEARRDRVMHGATYDPGSVALLDRQDDVLLWTWTSANRGLRCAALDVPKRPPEQQCQPIDVLRRSPYALQVNTEPLRRLDGRDDHIGYSGSVFIAAKGFVGGSLQRWEADPRMLNQGMSNAEVEAAARLSTDQKLEGLSIVGHWRGLPVWRGFAEDGVSQCLIVETPDPQRGCGSDGRTYLVSGGGVTIRGPANSEAEESSIVLEVPATEERPSAIFEMRTRMYFGSYLMITENAAVGVASLFVPE